jgi:transposase
VLGKLGIRRFFMEVSVTAEIHKLPQPKLHLYCAKCGVVSEPRCDCNVGYITAGEVARRAVAAKPEMSDRAIAEAIGVSDQTVGRARKKLTATFVAVDGMRTGKDGKKRSQPRRKKPKHAREVEDRAARMKLDEGKTYEEVTAATGVSEGTLTKAVAREEGLREAQADLKIDVTTLSMTAQQKLATGERQMRRRLDAEYAARIRNLDEEVRQQVLTRNREYLAKLNAMEDEAAETKRTYREFMDRQKKIFTKDEYRLVVMCVHADASISDEKRNEATRLLIAKRFALTGEKQA